MIFIFSLLFLSVLTNVYYLTVDYAKVVLQADLVIVSIDMSPKVATVLSLPTLGEACTICPFLSLFCISLSLSFIKLVFCLVPSLAL